MALSLSDSLAKFQLVGCVWRCVWQLRRDLEPGRRILNVPQSSLWEKLTSNVSHNCLETDIDTHINMLKLAQRRPGGSYHSGFPHFCC